MRIKNVADLIAETLQEAGVARIYGVVGDSLNGITEALRARGDDRLDPRPPRGGRRPSRRAPRRRSPASSRSAPAPAAPATST